MKIIDATNMKEGEFIAQGDIVLIKTPSRNYSSVKIPKKIENPVVLAEGEATGHKHAFYENAVMFRDDAIARSMDIPELYIGHVKIGKEGSILKHEEHDHIKLDGDSVFIVRRQREYTSRDAVRIVAD